MHELVVRAITEGEEFWREIGLDYNSEDDDDYMESSVEEDEVDSDFDVSDDEGEGMRARSKSKKGHKKASSNNKHSNGKEKKKEVKKRQKKVAEVESVPNEENAVVEAATDAQSKPIFLITRSSRNGCATELTQIVTPSTAAAFKEPEAPAIKSLVDDSKNQ